MLSSLAGVWAVDSLDFRIKVGGGAEHGYEVVLRGPDGGEVSNAVQLRLAELEALAKLVPDALIASSVRLTNGSSRNMQNRRISTSISGTKKRVTERLGRSIMLRPPADRGTV